MNLLESVIIMKITVSTNSKTITIDYYISINFTHLDFDSNCLFIWLGDIIVASLVIPNDVDFELFSTINNKDNIMYFKKYNDFIAYFVENNLNFVK